MIINNTEELYIGSLTSLLESQLWFSPLYHQSALNYHQHQTEDRGKTVNNHSFILLNNNVPVIGFIGAIVDDKTTTELLSYESPCISIENKNKLTAKTGKIFLKEFDQIVEKVNGIIWYRDFINCGELSTLSRHLLRKGAKSYPVFSQVIDLNRSEDELKRALRKSYNSLINWGNRELKPQIISASNVTWEKMKDFQDLHMREAGRKTRSEESWNIQFEMVRAGEAFLVMGNFDDELVSAGLFSHTKTNCYYGTSASRRDFFAKPLFHSLMWTAILHAKKLGCRWFEAGQQDFLNHPQENPPSKKELGISLFKAGFGGQTRMFLDLKLDCSQE